MMTRFQRAKLASAIAIVSLLLLTEVIPGALAADFQAQNNESINLTPDTTSFVPTRAINLANTTDPSQVQLERDVLNPNFMEVGKYLGPYIRTSEFRFTYDVGGNFSFSSTFNFTHQEIMGGVGEFWVRWPVDATDYSHLCVDISNYTADAAHFGSLYSRCAGTPQIPVGSVPLLNLGKNAFADSEGIYTKYWGYLFPGRPYTFTFTGTLTDTATPRVWATIERFQIENETTYTFENFLRGSHHTETFPLYPAFAFNFITSLGDGGLTAYSIPFDGSNSTFIGANYVGLIACTNAPGHPCGSQYVSFYAPFLDATQVNWKITVPFTCFGPPGPYVGVFFNYLNTFWVNGTNQFLLASTPWNVTTMAIPGILGRPNATFVYPGNGTRFQLPPGVGIPCDPGWGSGLFRFYLSANKPVTLLGYAPETDQFGSDLPFYFHDSDGVIYGDIFHITNLGGNNVPLFLQADFTIGRWAKVTPGTFFSTYDFGWGRAFLFPGQVDLVMFLQNGTAIGFNSVERLPTNGTSPGTGESCSFISVDSSNPFKTVADWLNQFACWVYSFVVKPIIGVLSTVFNAIWNAIRTLGEWIFSALVSFIDMVVKIATSIVQVTEDIIFSLLVALPFIMVVFVGGKGLPGLDDLRSGYNRVKEELDGVRGRRGIAYEPARRAVAAQRGLRARYHERQTKRSEARLKNIEESEKESKERRGGDSG